MGRKRDVDPEIHIKILPSVYEPERYRRGIAILQSELVKALSTEARRTNLDSTN